MNPWPPRCEKGPDLRAISGDSRKARSEAPLQRSWEWFGQGHPEDDLPNSSQLIKEEAACQTTFLEWITPPTRTWSTSLRIWARCGLWPSAPNWRTPWPGWRTATAADSLIVTPSLRT